MFGGLEESAVRRGEGVEASSGQVRPVHSQLAAGENSPVLMGLNYNCLHFGLSDKSGTMQQFQ